MKSDLYCPWIVVLNMLFTPKAIDTAYTLHTYYVAYLIGLLLFGDSEVHASCTTMLAVFSSAMIDSLSDNEWLAL